MKSCSFPPGKLCPCFSFSLIIFSSFVLLSVLPSPKPLFQRLPCLWRIFYTYIYIYYSLPLMFFSFKTFIIVCLFSTTMCIYFIHLTQHICLIFFCHKHLKYTVFIPLPLLHFICPLCCLSFVTNYLDHALHLFLYVDWSVFPLFLFLTDEYRPCV